MGELLLIEIHQLAHANGCCQGADRGRGVKDAVVRTAKKLTYTNTGFVTGHCRNDQFAAGLTQVLGSGQNCREHYRRRMQHGAVVQVVLLHQVRAGTVNQRSEIRGAGFAADQDCGRSTGRAHHCRVALEQWDRM